MTHLALLCIALLFALCLVACYGWRRAERQRNEWMVACRDAVRGRTREEQETQRLRLANRDCHERWLATFEERNELMRENEALRRQRKEVAKWN